MLRSSLSLCLLLLVAPVRADDQNVNEELRAELLIMFKEDQALRQKIVEFLQRNPNPDPKKVDKDPNLPAVKQLHDLDRQNTKRLKVLIDTYGWPGFSLAGRDGAHAAWLLVQHADQDRPFQKKCLKLMEEAAKKGDASRSDIAYLTDRVLVGEGKKQRDGTQFILQKGDWVPQPIEDEANVDKRRTEVDLPSLAEYKKMIKEQYKVPGEKK